MRGYLSFVLVFLSLLLMFSLIKIGELSPDLSKATVVGRTYSVHMNVKECILEAARQGAREGFMDYDKSHNITLCRHCLDFSCLPNPAAPNRCDLSECNKCFREADARAKAEEYAKAWVTALRLHKFDPDFSLQISDPELEAFTKPDLLAKNENGYALDYVRFRKDLKINLTSEKFDITAKSRIPVGVMVNYERAGNS